MVIYVGSFKYSPIFKSSCCAFGTACEKQGYHVKYLFSQAYEWMLPPEVKEKTIFVGRSTSLLSTAKDSVNLRGRKVLQQAFQKDNPTHVYLHNYHPLNHYVAKLANEHKSIFIYHVHEPYTKDKKAHGIMNGVALLSFFEYMQEKLLDKTKIAIVSSKYASLLLKERYPLFSGKTMHIPLMYEDLGGNGGDHEQRKNITFIGPPLPAKGIAKYLEIVDYSHDNDLGFNYLLISRSKVSSQFYARANLKVFNKSKISDEEFGALIKGSIAVLTPYRRETQSSVILVSHMYGTPVVSSEVGGLSEFVSPGSTGFLHDKDAHPGEWLESMRSIQKNFPIMSEACRTSFVQSSAGENWKKYLGRLLS